MDSSQQDFVSFLPGVRFFKKSHRTLPEQLLGLGIFLLLSLGLEFVNGKLIQLTLHSAIPDFIKTAKVYREPLGFVNFEGSQSSSDLSDRVEGNIASILPTKDHSKMDHYDSPTNSQNLMARSILVEQSHNSIWTFYYLFLSFSAWTLWRRFSLRVLKLEMSVFLAQFLFQIAWNLSFFTFQATLLALGALVLLFCNNLLAALLFWKKERLSGQLLLVPFAWIFFCLCLNMIICIFNP
jgi:hypothetical protein